MKTCAILLYICVVMTILECVCDAELCSCTVVKLFCFERSAPSNLGRQKLAVWFYNSHYNDWLHKSYGLSIKRTSQSSTFTQNRYSSFDMAAYFLKRYYTIFYIRTPAYCRNQRQNALYFRNVKNLELLTVANLFFQYMM